jgi:hypothetical protein
LSGRGDGEADRFPHAHVSAKIVAYKAFARRRKSANGVEMIRRGLRQLDVAVVIVNARAEHAVTIESMRASNRFMHVESLGPDRTWVREGIPPGKAIRIVR